MTIEKNNSYSCDGSGFCGGTNAENGSIVEFAPIFRCEYCSSFQKAGHHMNIVDKRKITELGAWL